MDIRRFVAENRADWERLETLLRQAADRGLHALPPAELRELGLLHRKASADLAAARTFAAGAKVIAYINDLALRSHNVVYSAPRPGLLGSVLRLARAVPEAVRAHTGALAAATIIFVTGALLGAFGTILDENVAVLIMGGDFVEQIRDGHYWIALTFRVVPPQLASAGILANNLTVSIALFAFGITGLLPALILFWNGLMLGAVLVLCAQYGLIARFTPFVVPHGVIEISALLLAGAGGLAIFDGWLHPEDRPRLAALNEASRQGLKVALAAFPTLILAAVVEGVISPSETIPGVLRVALGIALGIALWSWLLGTAAAPIAATPQGRDYSRPRRLISR